MRTLNIDELSTVQGGKLSAAMAINIINVISDAISLIDAAMKVDFESMVSNSSVDLGNVNPMGDYSNSMCTR
jgi:bacteriocin-like protein